MSRINYSEDENYPGQFDLYQANCTRSLRGKAGQQELRSLRDALLELPEKKLIYGSLVNTEGEVCAIGAYARHNGIDLQKFDPEDATDEVGTEAGMPRLVAWKVVEMNDVYLRGLSPEQRYMQMLKWVESNLRS